MSGRLGAAYRALAGEYPPGPLRDPPEFGPARTIETIAIAAVGIALPYLLLRLAGVNFDGRLAPINTFSLIGTVRLLLAASRWHGTVHSGWVLPPGSDRKPSGSFTLRPVAHDGFGDRLELVWRPWTLACGVPAATVLIGVWLARALQEPAGPGAPLPLAVLTITGGLGLFFALRAIASFLLRARVVALARRLPERAIS